MKEGNNMAIWVPFNTGSGPVPPTGTFITQGSVTAELQGIFDSAFIQAVVSGTMPSTGFMKFVSIGGGVFSEVMFDNVSAKPMGPAEARFPGESGNHLHRIMALAVEHKQNTPSDTWVVDHNLNRLPVIDTYVNIGGNLEFVVPLNVSYDNPNTCTVSFSEPQSGFAQVT